jgi:hypothetical protein
MAFGKAGIMALPLSVKLGLRNAIKLALRSVVGQAITATNGSGLPQRYLSP